MKAYKRQLATKEEIKKKLGEIGYDKREVEMIISIWDMELNENRIDNIIKSLLEQYATGVIEEKGLKRELRKLNLPQSRIQSYLEEAKYEKLKELKLPSKSDLLDWLTAGLINKKQFTDKMLRKGYLQEDIQKYIEQAK